MRARDECPRTARPATFHEVLILTLLAIFGLSGGAADMPHAIKKSVRDPERREQAISAAQRLDAEFAALRIATVEARKEVYAVLERRGTSLAELSLSFDSLDAQAARFAQNVVALRFEMRDAMTRDEWAEMFRRLDD